jgi:predicted nucleic acid-binding protein
LPYLLDTNILIRLASYRDPMRQDARKSIRRLFDANEKLFLTPQNLYEFWVVATRPVSANGLGFSPKRTHALIERSLIFFTLLPEAPGILEEWLRIVETYSIVAVHGHDARLAAAMKVHRITHLLTFNTSDFKLSHPAEITVLSPSDILARPAT